jgi:trans-aconitate methyltransferase
LDAGCGTGSLTFPLAQRAKDLRIQGIDFSPAYIEHATQHNHNRTSHSESAMCVRCPLLMLPSIVFFLSSSFTSFPTPIERC